MAEREMTGTEAAQLLAKSYKLNKTEQRLLAYQIDHSPEISVQRTCDDLDMDPKKLLKTKVSLDRKLNLNSHAGIEDQLRKERAKDGVPAKLRGPVPGD